MNTSAGRSLRADLLISVGLLVIFAGGLVMAFGFPFRARMVPLLVCGVGVAMCVLQLILLAVERNGVRRLQTLESTAERGMPPEPALDTDEEEAEHAFITASPRAWLETLGWFGGFFVAVWLVGLLPAVVVFTIGYLLIVGRVRVIWALVYALLSWGLLYLVFDQLLRLPLPEGMLW